MGYLRNENGFSMLTMILIITITLSLFPLLAYLLKSVNFSSNYDELSINQFFTFFRNEFIEATHYDVTPEKVTLHLQDDRKASFLKYNDLIIRRIDGGYEVYLRDIKDLTFRPLPYGIQTIITSLQGEQYEKTIVFYQ